jgi:hypothetical protein
VDQEAAMISSIFLILPSSECEPLDAANAVGLAV